MKTVIFLIHPMKKKIGTKDYATVEKDMIYRVDYRKRVYQFKDSDLGKCKFEE
jgi:hypothetical protein